MVAKKPAASPLRKGRRWMLSMRRCENCEVHVLVTLAAAAAGGGGAAGWTTGGGGGLIGSLIIIFPTMVLVTIGTGKEIQCPLSEMIHCDAERRRATGRFSISHCSFENHRERAVHRAPE